MNPTHYQLKQPTVIGILLVNLGSPDAPTPNALRRYLAEFLSDPRITEISPWIWKPILHGIILRTRPRRSARYYQKIWTEAGSPLLVNTQKQTIALQRTLESSLTAPVRVTFAMRYGNPSIANGLEQLQSFNAQRILILPLYPQYSSSTTGSTFDAIGDVFKQWRWLPDVRFISHYHTHPSYIDALVAHIQAHWSQQGKPDKLLFSFHGIPKRFSLAGDPYYYHCQETVQLVNQQLGLTQEQGVLTFQSRFGREEWLKPYTDHRLIAFGNEGVKRIDVICPGFASDCLETLEEIDHECRQLFMQAGGQAFHYIPALNDSDKHIEALHQLVMHELQGWFVGSRQENTN